MQTADEIFCLELEKLGIDYSVTPERLYELRVNDQEVTVSLENIRRNFARDRDAEVVAQFAQQVNATFVTELPSWDVVHPYVRYSLEPADYETGFKNVLYDAINDDLNKVYVYTPADGSTITWISEFMLDDWGMTRQQIVQQAEKNMDKIIAEARFEIESVDGYDLGMISTEETAFKASLILSPAFRDFVSPALGWPVYVVVPCRDFAYVISKNSRDFLGRLGGVVIREYYNSGHSITKDVLQVSGDGITAIGTYPDPE